ncbi:MAG: acyltransferase [Verrucomicrobiae bacterium]
MALPIQNRVYYPLLDTLRGPAAMLVFLGHWRNLFFADFVDLPNPGIALKIFYLFTGAGREAVMIFFVISGCVIAHVIYTSFERGKWSWSGYLWARLTRLWVVLIPALVLTACWDQFGMRFGQIAPSIYDGIGFANILHSAVEGNSGIGTFIGNVLFVQTILVPTFGSNGPLWSIAYEFCYYLAYPAMICAVVPGRATWKLRAGLLFFAGALLVFSGKSIAAAFLIWLAGAAAYWLFRVLPVKSVAINLVGFLAGLLAILASVMASRMHLYSAMIGWDGIIGLACAFTMYFALAIRPSRVGAAVLKPLHGLSAVSYSVYLLHMPILVCAASFFFRSDSKRWPPDLPHLSAAVVIGLLVFAYCLGVWYLTEHQTARIRGWFGALRAARQF